jgi:hypothetical protein
MKLVKSSYGIAKAAGPFATVYACPCCKFLIRIPRSRPGDRVGRGYGLRTGGAAFSKMCAHVRNEHPEQPK